MWVDIWINPSRYPPFKNCSTLNSCSVGYLIILPTNDLIKTFVEIHCPIKIQSKGLKADKIHKCADSAYALMFDMEIL